MSTSDRITTIEIDLGLAYITFRIDDEEIAVLPLDRRLALTQPVIDASRGSFFALTKPSAPRATRRTR
jgi:hypothetical protein